MEVKLCEACRKSGKYNSGHYHDEIYNSRGPVMISLCYYHSVELFKMGQKNFISKYRPDFLEYDLTPKDSYGPLKNYFTINSFR